jgi:glycosyltransferase involved in cell wall biosynthesis
MAGLFSTISLSHMHIAFVTPEFLRGTQLYPGGLSTYTFNTASVLKSLGHDVTIFLSGESDREFEFKGLRVIERKPRIPLLFRPVDAILKSLISDGLERIWSSFTINKTVGKEISKLNIDVVHYTNWKAVGLFRVSHPSLLRISSYDQLWDNNPGNRHIGKRFVQWLEKKSIRRFEHIIGPGDHLAKFIEEDLGLKHPIELLPTPVDIKSKVSDKRSDQGSNGSRKKVLYAGTVSKIKGAELLFEIIKSYLERYDDTDFIIAGKAGIINGASSKTSLETLSAMFPTSFQYHPHLERSLLDREYATADLVIIPSLIDNFPNTALEAMSNGTFVLASDTASLGTLLKDGVNGFVMRGREPQKWIERMRYILFDLKDDERASMIGQMNASLVEHGKDHAIELLVSVYGRVAGNKS